MADARSTRAALKRADTARCTQLNIFLRGPNSSVCFLQVGAAPRSHAGRSPPLPFPRLCCSVRPLGLHRGLVHVRVDFLGPRVVFRVVVLRPGGDHQASSVSACAYTLEWTSLVMGPRCFCVMLYAMDAPMPVTHTPPIARSLCSRHHSITDSIAAVVAPSRAARFGTGLTSSAPFLSRRAPDRGATAEAYSSRDRRRGRGQVARPNRHLVLTWKATFPAPRKTAFFRCLKTKRTKPPPTPHSDTRLARDDDVIVLPARRASQRGDRGSRSRAPRHREEGVISSRGRA